MGSRQAQHHPRAVVKPVIGGVLRAPRRSKKALMGVFALLFAVVGTYLIINSFAAQPTVANFWIDTSGGSCTRQAVAGSYSDAQACGSMKAAYEAASSGDVVVVKPGSYGGQYFAGARDPNTGNNTTGGSKIISFVGDPDNPSNVKLLQLAVDSDNMSFNGFDVDYQGGNPGGSGGAVLDVGGILNFTFKNGRVGNVAEQKGAMLAGRSDPAKANMVIDNVDFHDVYAFQEGTHNECIMSHSPGVTIRNSRFINCTTMDISLGLGDWWGQPQYGNVTLENNVFGHSTNGTGFHAYGLAWWLSSMENVRVVNNTFENSVIMDRANATGSGVWANNIGSGWDCGVSGITYTGNVGQKCSASDYEVSPASSCGPPACPTLNRAPMGFVDPANWDFHLTSTSIARDKANATYAPATDKDGNTRNGPPDAGAYEYGGTPSGGEVANIWVDLNGGSCTRSASAAAYNDAQACSSFNAALAAASRGDTVMVKAGTYAPQRLSAVPTGSSGYVVFRPATGESVQIGNGTSGNCKGSTSSFWQLCVEGADWLELRDFSVFNNGNIGAIGVVQTGSSIGSQNVILRNISALAVRMQGPVDNIQILGGDYGGDLTDGTFSHVSYLDDNTKFPSNVTFDGVRFHDIQSDTAGDHMECILANAFTNLTLINSRFEMCGQNGQSTGDIHFNDDLGASSGYTIRNNFFGDNGSGGHEVVINGDIAGTKIFEFNSVAGSVSISDGFSGGPMTARGNYASSITCLAGVTYEYNVTTSSACSGTGNTLVSALDFVSSSLSSFNLHLATGASAIGKVAANCPVTDIDGESRPATNCDAGADEVSAGGGGGGTSTDTTPPSNISGLTMSGNSVTTITLDWTAATDNVGVTGYRMYRDDQVITSTTSTTYTYTGLTCGTTYTLAVEPYDAAGNVHTRAEATTVRSTAACGTPADTTAPTVPSGLAMTNRTSSSISVGWNAATDSGGSGLAGYRLYRGGSLLATISAAASRSHTDSGLSANTAYSYQIAAYDNAGNESAKSSAVAISTLSAATGGSGGGTPAPTPAPASKKGDLNGDNKVDLKDLSMLLTRYRTNNSAADINKDNWVDLKDLSILLSNYGK
jgi:chitodextrinase